MDSTIRCGVAGLVALLCHCGPVHGTVMGATEAVVGAAHVTSTWVETTRRVREEIERELRHHAFSSTAGAETFGHVRSEQATVRSWLTEGYERSATFRALVDEIDGLHGIVYIDGMAAVPAGLDAALLHTVAGSRELPILRIVVRFSLSRTVGIATLAHELQHVAEVLRAGQTTDSSAMTVLFRAIDETHGVGSGRFETQEARQVAARVRNELRLNPRR
jgi:hypothetical protein